MRRDTPAEAPPVRKMWAGSDGCPSRSVPQVSWVQVRVKKEQTADELCDTLANERDALRVRVCPDGSDFVVQLFGTGNDVLRKYVWREVGEVGVFHQSSNLEGVSGWCCEWCEVRTCLTKVMGGWSRPFC